MDWLDGNTGWVSIKPQTGSNFSFRHLYSGRRMVGGSGAFFTAHRWTGLFCGQPDRVDGRRPRRRFIIQNTRTVAARGKNNHYPPLLMPARFYSLYLPVLIRRSMERLRSSPWTGTLSRLNFIRPRMGDKIGPLLPASRWVPRLVYYRCRSLTRRIWWRPFNGNQVIHMEMAW